MKECEEWKEKVDALLTFAAGLHRALTEDDRTIADEAWRALPDELGKRVETIAQRMREDDEKE